MSLCQMHSISLMETFNGRTHGWSNLCARLASEDQTFSSMHWSITGTKYSVPCHINFRFRPDCRKASQFTKRLYRQGIQLGRRRLPQCAMAMEKMEITDEQIRQEKQRIEEEEMFLGKEDLPEVSENADEAGPTIGVVGSEIRECWDLWQRIGLPVQKIAKQRHMTETGVFYCIFTCIQNNYTVDWYELCKEAQFTLAIAKRMIQATEKFMANNSTGHPVEMHTLRQHLPSDVSEIHFGLFVTMLGRDLPYETIKEISFQPRNSKPEMEWGEEYADEERFPKEATESTLLQWFTEKDGASMIEIALKFRECDDLHLMRLILKLEGEGKLFWRQGIFRAV